MMSEVIRFVLGNLPVFLFVAALVVATLHKAEPNTALRYLSWLLLLSVGVEMLWAGLFHIFFPGIASASIGWAPSPFEFEIGVADAACGVVAVTSYWRSLDFKAAITWYVSLFYFGVAVGHFKEAFIGGNYAANNFGLLLALTVIKMIALPLLLRKARKDAYE